MPTEIQRRCRAAAATALLAGALASGALAADLTPLVKVEPRFPQEAVSAGADKGRVTARMTVDATGEVTRVEILEAAPRRLFEREVIRSLSQWRFASGAAGRSMEIEIEFHR
jgi:protein TonB